MDPRSDLDLLLGDWNMVGTHPAFAAEAKGHSSFEWLGGGTLLVWRFDWQEPGPPSAVSIIGRDDVDKTYTMLYSDVRRVERIYHISLEHGIWKMWRESPGFSQRMTGTFSEDGKVIRVRGELSRDDSTWGPDLEITYTKESQHI